MTPQQSRDKRRFYVKKIAIGLDRFKEWEEQLGDQWYRHHNLYVTEEGHAHPPFTNSVTNLGDWALPSSSSEFVSIDCKPQINSVLSKGCGTSQSSKRQRTADEDYSSKKIPLLCQQQLLQLFSMQGDPIHETMMTEVHSYHT
ncbi:unnamed protein product [Anisakis simplex]|uniref:Expressed conserved protein n=1 Tax=Anisakis simplex TaxID=6269 RepID=A0A0M3K3P2_ANISI|nr:unnamed protein product [Anisakis simplex]